MIFNWQLLLLMLAYGFFNGTGSLFYKIGLGKIQDENVNFISWNKANVKGFLKIISTPIWLLGLGFLGIDLIIYQYAIRNYDVSIVKPLINLNMIFVLLYGVLVIKEKIRIREWAGIALIAIGAILITSNSTPQETVINYTAFWLLFGICLGILSVLIIINIRASSHNYEYYVSILCGVLFGLGGIANKGLYAVNIRSGYYWILSGIFVVTYIIAFFYGQAAYLKGRMSIVSTLVNIVSILTPFVGGILIFGEPLIITELSGIYQWIKVFGLAVIIAGIGFNYSKN